MLFNGGDYSRAVSEIGTVFGLVVSCYHCRNVTSFRMYMFSNMTGSLAGNF